MKFRDETEVVQLWHAPGASKKFGGSVCSPEELEILSMASENTDYLITSSKKVEKEYVEAFQIDKSKIEVVMYDELDSIDISKFVYIEPTKSKYWVDCSDECEHRKCNEISNKCVNAKNTHSMISIIFSLI